MNQTWPRLEADLTLTCLHPGQTCASHIHSLYPAFGFVDEGAVRYDGLIFREPEQSFSGSPDLRTVQPFVTAAC
ncbi:hypothetical protein QPK13_24035, partial [Photorhabdus tasmaniensis]